MKVFFLSSIYVSLSYVCICAHVHPPVCVLMQVPVGVCEYSSMHAGPARVCAHRCNACRVHAHAARGTVSACECWCWKREDKQVANSTNYFFINLKGNN